jgi:hypothetical protein
MTLENTSEKLEKPLRDELGRLLPNQESLNPNGRPKGSISPITRVKQIFEEDPTKFAEFIEKYIEDSQNRKHIVEMIDGKPKQDIGVSGDLTINVIDYTNASNDSSKL